MKILITGSRLWPTRYRKKIWSAIIELIDTESGEITELIFGDCRDGVDAHAKALAEAMEALNYPIRYREFEAYWNDEGRAAGPNRNQRMVDYGANACLAFFHGPSFGTKDCRKRARAAKIPTRSFDIHGELEDV